MTLRELEHAKAALNKIRSRCCYCRYNSSCKFLEPYCDLLESPVKIGSKCPLENKKSPERPDSSKEV